jgi:hypothetical protein
MHADARRCARGCEGASAGNSAEEEENTRRMHADRSRCTRIQTDRMGGETPKNGKVRRLLRVRAGFGASYPQGAFHPLGEPEIEGGAICRAGSEGCFLSDYSCSDQGLGCFGRNLVARECRATAVAPMSHYVARALHCVARCRAEGLAGPAANGHRRMFSFQRAGAIGAPGSL